MGNNGNVLGIRSGRGDSGLGDGMTLFERKKWVFV
jgi:hypothetical protein